LRLLTGRGDISYANKPDSACAWLTWNLCLLPVPTTSRD
jgi:hypothetical protein